MAANIPEILTSPFDPRTSALPPIPSPTKGRKSLPSPSVSRLPSAPNTPSRLRTPSKTGLPIPGGSATPGTPPIPTLKDNFKSPEEKLIRRSVSIAAFPQPPRPVTTRIGKLNHKPSLATGLMINSLDARTPSRDSTISSPQRPSSADTLKIRRLRKPTKQASLNAAFVAPSSPSSNSLLSSGGEHSTVPANPSTEGLPNLNSPSQSRSSSPDGSYSTQATTFEEDEVAGTRNSSTNDDSERGSQSGKEAKGNVIVSVRVRPNAARDANSEGEWMVDGRRALVAFRGKEGGDYFYDNVFATHDDNGRVYESSAKRLVRRVMEGYNGTVFAYGMTGTGKTFSMQGTTESPGVIPRAITDIFSFIRETPHREFLLRASYLEIYNEDIRDLLAAAPMGGAAPEKIKLREDGKRGVYATPLREEIVQSPMQLLRVISRGDKARHTGHTQYNAHSSRSHAVVQIVVESRERATTIGEKRTAIGPGGVRVSTLSLIDLAGSERAADNKERRTEGAHINKSLLTLGTVIAKLSGAKDKQGNPLDRDGKHLPYRDSKLTRLLQPALSGDSLISILCTIQIGAAGSAAAPNNHTGETLNTLKFAARAKNNIVSHAKKAEEALGVGGEARGLLERYRLEIETLRQQLNTQTQAQIEKEDEQIEKEAHNRHQDQLLELQLARTALKERIEHLNRLILSSQSTGVNSSGTFSALGMHSTLASVYGSIAGGASVRSSTSMSTLQRSASGASTATMSQYHGPIRTSSSTNTLNRHIPEDEEVIDTDEAPLEQQNRALRTDLSIKNRYISKLEQRLLQARRTSSSRTSVGFGAATLEEKDAEIATLKAELADRDRTIAELRMLPKPVAEKSVREPLAKLNTINSPKKHQPNSSNDSSLTSASNSFSPVEVSLKKSPFELLSGQGPSTAGTSPSNSIGIVSAKGANRKSIDEMSRMLDEMIQERVEKGELTTSKNGSVRIVRERRQDSRGNSLPTVGAMAASLRTDSVVDIGLGLTL